MSLRIDVDEVFSVLLADGWHAVADASFDVDAYEFVEGAHTLVGGGQVEGVPSTGATWQEAGSTVVVPLTAILALRLKLRKLSVTGT